MTLSWAQIARLGLVQMALGAIVVLTTSTLNRLMIVEYALPAILPGALVGLHYGIQMSRPKWGFASDEGGNRTRWIIGGMFILAAGALLAAFAVTLFANSFALGLGLSVLAYALIGLGVGASGTSLLAFLASATAPLRRAAAATLTWLMMIFGIAVTAGVSGGFLDPYSPGRLMVVVAVVVSLACLLTIVAVGRIERHVTQTEPPADNMSFREGLAEIWEEPKTRNFTLFIFLSMNAYFMQELILEPFAGLVFNFTPGQSTSLSGAQNGGVFLGMLTVGIAATGLKWGSLRAWVIVGCLGSSAVLSAIAVSGLASTLPLTALVVGLGFFNGMFAVAAIGSMMALASDGRGNREGTRMGLWGAAQAIAAGFGGLVGAALVDATRAFMPDGQAFATVFSFEAVLFLAAAAMAARIMHNNKAPSGAMVPGE